MKAWSRRASALLVALLLALGMTSPAGTQQPPPVEFVANPRPSYTFGQGAFFLMEAVAQNTVSAVYLYIQPQGEQHTEVHDVPFTQDGNVRAVYERDLSLDPFPPFGEVRWRWEILDEAGNSASTETASFEYVDNRFTWHTVSDSPVWVHAVVSDPAYLQAALDTARNAFERISTQFQPPPLDRVDVFLYPSQDDIRAALEMAGREWVGGQARPELGVVLVEVPQGDRAVSRMERDIPHELTHLLIYHTVGAEGYQYVPMWLNEGLATVSETRPDPELAVTLEEARVQAQLIPLTDLCTPFPHNRDAALLSYAESASVVRYIQSQYGSSGIRSLLEAYADGSGCEGGVNRALHTSLERLDLNWRADLAGLSGWLTWASENRTILLVWGLSLLLALPMAGQLRRRGATT